MAKRRRKKPEEETTTRSVFTSNPSPVDIESLIVDPSEIQTGGSYLFYGRSGTGKTTISTSFPKPLLHIDLRENTSDSLQGIKDLKTASISNWDQIDALYWWLAESDQPFKTLVIDTVSQLQELALNKVLEMAGKPEGPIFKNDWGEAAGLLKRMIVSFRDLIDDRESNIQHVVFLGQDRISSTDEDEDDGDEIEPVVGVALMPSVAKLINAAVKVIGNTFIKEVVKKGKNGKVKTTIEYGLRLGPHMYYTTKIRSRKETIIPSSITDPTYEKIQQIMRGEFKDGEEKQGE